MNKIKYTEPEMEIIAFENEDVITASGNGFDLFEEDTLSGTGLYS